MELSLQQIFDRARATQEWLPAAEAELSFTAAVRLAAEQGAPLRPARMLLSEAGVLTLSPRDPGEDRAGYLAPELLTADPPRRTEGRVQVFAAGALGYELFTGRTPPEPPTLPGSELGGPLADLVKVALSADRRERFGDLQQLLDAVEVIQPRRPEVEQAGLSALFARARRWEAWLSAPATAERLERMGGELGLLSARLATHEGAVGRLADQEHLGARVAALEAALQALKTQQEASMARLGEAVHKAQAARAAAEQRARDEAETREALARLHPPPSAFSKALLPALLGGLLGAAAAIALLLGGAGTGLLGGTRAKDDRGGPVAATAPPGGPAAQPAATSAPGAEPDGAQAAAAPSPAAPPHAGGSAAAPAADAGQAPATPAAPADTPSAALAAKPADGKTVEIKSGAPAVLVQPDAARPDPAKAEPARARSEGRREASAVSPQMMARAVARSQVARGDSALEKGRAAVAVTQFRTALENDPDLAEAHRGLGMAYAAQNLDALARKEYERYLVLAPDAEDAADIRHAIEELRSRSKLGGDEK